MTNKLSGIKQGEVVRIKFKSIQEMTKRQNMTNKLHYLSEYDIGSNVNALILGGDFVVISADAADAQQEPHIEVDNHHDGGSFIVFNELIDTIEVVDVANKFVSEEHGICMIQVDDKIYINGELLEDNPDHYEEDYKDLLTKFVKFMEKYVVAKAFEGSLDDE